MNVLGIFSFFSFFHIDELMGKQGFSSVPNLRGPWALLFLFFKGSMQKFKDPVLLFTYFFALNGYIEYLKIDILCLLLKINMINDPSITCISGNYNSF